MPSLKLFFASLSEDNLRRVCVCAALVVCRRPCGGCRLAAGQPCQLPPKLTRRPPFCHATRTRTCTRKLTGLAGGPAPSKCARPGTARWIRWLTPPCARPALVHSGALSEVRALSGLRLKRARE